MKRFVLSALLAGLCSGTAAISTASAQNYYVSEIITLAANFCPVGTLPANGALLAISTNIALFSLLGTTYGGDGQQTFALPNLKPIYAFNGSGSVSPFTGAPLTQCIVVSGIYPSRP